MVRGTLINMMEASLLYRTRMGRNQEVSYFQLINVTGACDLERRMGSPFCVCVSDFISLTETGERTRVRASTIHYSLLSSIPYLTTSTLFSIHPTSFSSSYGLPAVLLNNSDDR